MPGEMRQKSMIGKDNGVRLDESGPRSPCARGKSCGKFRCSERLSVGAKRRDSGSWQTNMLLQPAAIHDDQ